MRNFVKLFLMVLVLGITVTSCTTEDLVDDIDLKTEQNSTEGTNGEVKDKPKE